MSISKPFVVDGKNSGKVPEKKNFTQACNLLNQYLKQKGSLRDLNINGKLESIGRPETSQPTTVDFLSSMEKPSSPAPLVRLSTPPPEYSLPPLPQFIDVESFISGKPPVEAKTAAMTIFYGGQVMVFNDFSEEKVRELMMVASTSNTGAGEKVDRGKAPMISPENSVMSYGSQEEHRQRAIIGGENGSDLPIARRASLHKFLAKRKDRATARAAPYQVTTSTEKDEPKFDLNL